MTSNQLQTKILYKTTVKRHLLTAGQSNKADILATFKQLSWVTQEIFICLYNIKVYRFYVDLLKFINILLVEREMSVFEDDHALPDTSMRLSDYVLQTFLVNIFSLAIGIFPFLRWLMEISRWLPNSYVKQSGK